MDILITDDAFLTLSITSWFGALVICKSTDICDMKTIFDKKCSQRINLLVDSRVCHHPINKWIAVLKTNEYLVPTIVLDFKPTLTMLQNHGSERFVINMSQPCRNVLVEIGKCLSGERFSAITMDYTFPLHKVSLTCKQEEVLPFILSGMSANEISLELKCCVKTVYSHRSSIALKFGFKNFRGLCRYIINNGGL